MKKFISLLLPFILFLLFTGFHIGMLRFPLSNQKTPLVIAHRGDSVHAPENSLAAFDLALSQGADGIELDVRSSKDNIPVVFHDASLRRIFFHNLYVEDLTFSQLHQSEFFTGTGDLNTICSLEDVLLLCRSYPNTRIVMDLKVGGMEQKVVSLIEKYDLCSQCEIASEHPEILYKIKIKNPNLKTILLLSSAGSVFSYRRLGGGCLTETSLGLPSVFFPDGISARHLYITNALIQYAHARNQYVYAWTANKTTTINRLHHLGADGIITDTPSEAVRYIYADH